MTSQPFPARWPSDCAECGQLFERGDEIRWNDADELVGEACCGHVYGDDDDLDLNERFW